MPNSPATGAADRMLSDHYETLQTNWDTALSLCGYDAALVFAGAQNYFFQDDQGPAFKPNPMLVQWLPPAFIAPDSWMHIEAGGQPSLLFYQPKDYWHAVTEAPLGLGKFIRIEVFHELAALQARCKELIRPASRCALLGEIAQGQTNEILEGELNPAPLIHALNYQRAEKTQLELTYMRSASELGAKGHAAAASAFAAGGSEFDIHLAFMAATSLNEHQLPYPNIIGINEHASVLHYQRQDRQRPSFRNSLLIDAGAQVNGYASDITRTYIGDHGHSDTGSEIFAELLQLMQAHQNQLIDLIRPGQNYVDIQAQMHRQLGAVLAEIGLLTCSAEAAFEEHITESFCPHGLGHLLGIQVHDVGGQQVNIQGEQLVPPDNYAPLRLTRPMTENMVITVEPGLYFIPMLLEQERQKGSAINWSMAEQLMPFGGIRIEDNVRVDNICLENLTRDGFSLAGD